jgi:hypothetical protein
MRVKRRTSGVERTVLVAIISGLVASGVVAGPTLAACREPDTGTNDIPIFSPPLSEVVTGTGRLQFYSAPDPHCAMRGVFIIPNDEVITYAQSRSGWSSVMYANPGTGRSVSGWVKSTRLKEKGTIAPAR